MKKLYKIDFEPMYPVPYGLIILADDEDEAMEIASKTLGGGDKVHGIERIAMGESKVVFFESGEY